MRSAVGQTATFLKAFATESAISYAVMEIIGRLKPSSSLKKKTKEERKKEKLLSPSSIQESNEETQRPNTSSFAPSNMSKMLSDLTNLIAIYEEAALASLAAFQVLILTYQIRELRLV
jgi:hypothetical protein